MTAVEVPAPGAHGGDGARLAAALGVDLGAIVDLSASLNPAAPDTGQVVGKHLDALSRYPDPGPATAALAAALGVDADRVLLTNGGSEAIALVAAALGGYVDEPDFALYPRGTGPASPLSGPLGPASPLSGPLGPASPLSGPLGPRWRSNPHNPSGLLAGSGQGAQIWDEAFYPLATGEWSRGDADEGAVVVGSLTKVFACPGLRVGYVLAPDAGFARRLAGRQTTWSVNGLAAAAVPDLLAGADLPGWAALVVARRADLRAVLATFGLDAGPSDAPWLLVRAAGLRARLAPHGVLVRDCASFGLPDHFRIAVPDAAGLSRLAEALEASTP